MSLPSFSNYSVIRELGQGGMATVYLANHNSLGHHVAIKVLDKQFAFNDNIKARFVEEAKKLVRLDHPNVVKVTDFISENGTVAIVMEYIQGKSFRELLNAKRLNDSEIENYLNQMVVSLNYIHKEGIVHRDIKPSNFIIGTNGVLKLVDFGISKSIDNSTVDHTSTSTNLRMGTLMYMSPEQVKSTKDVTYLSDIYSLGIVLWEMVIGKVPYNSNELSAFEIQVKIVQESLPKTNTKWDEYIQIATSKEENQRVRFVDLLGVQNSESNEKKDSDDNEETKIEEGNIITDSEIPSDRFNLASRFKRFWNLIIDYFFIFILSILIIFVFIPENYINFLDETIFEVLVFVLYYVICELTFKTTLAKYFTNTKTIFLPSREKLIWRIIKRTSFRVFPIFYLFGIKDTFLHDRVSNVEVVNILDVDRKKYRKIRFWIISAILSVIVIMGVGLFLNTDSDNDGFKDMNDECPNEFGNLNGCLDSDNDKIVDSLDICPDSYGFKKSNGCPKYESITFENKNKYNLKFAIAFFDINTKDYQIDGHYEIKPFESFEYPLPKNYSYDKIYLRAFLEDENGTPFVWWGDESEYEFCYSIDNILETYSSVCTLPKKGYEEFELNEAHTRYSLFLK
jgi:serine/threonine protein kinase